MSRRANRLRFQPAYSATAPFELMRTMDCDCYHCGRSTRHVLEYAEDEETRYWRERSETLMGKLNQAVADCRARFGDDPMSIMFIEELLKIRTLFGLDEGEEWKRKKP